MDSEMDFLPEPKPVIETKSNEECSGNFIINVLPKFDENDKTLEFSNCNSDLEAELLKNKKEEEKLYSGVLSKSIKHSDCEDQERENKMNVTKKLKTEDKTDGDTVFFDDCVQLQVDEKEVMQKEKELIEIENNFQQQINIDDASKDGFITLSVKSNSSEMISEFELHGKLNEDKKREYKMSETIKLETEDKNDGEKVYSENREELHVGEKEVVKEEREIVEMENDFQQQINIHDDVSSDDSNASSVDSSSSGILTDFESLDNSDENISENDGQIGNSIFEKSSAKQFPDVHSDSTNFPLSKRENESSENLAVEEKKQDKINSVNDEENISKEDKGAVFTTKNVSLFDRIKFPYKDPSNAFDVVVPLIGQNVMSFGHVKPFHHRYDLAREINRLKGIEDAPYLPKLSYHEWRKQRDARPQEEKDREEKYEKYIAIKTAAYIIKTTTYILHEMQKDNPDEGIIERCFVRFLRAPCSNLSLILSSQFIHVMMYIRGTSHFSHRLRHVADECYMRCHVMFPIPDGYNFETVYTSECVKNLPEELNDMRNCILDYGGLEYPISESDDSAISDDNGDSEYHVSETDD